MRILFGLIFIITVRTAWSQETDCAQSLNLAQDEFNAGRFYGLSSIIKECLETKAFTREQEVRAYLLLAQTYLLIDDPIAAEDSYLKLLKADPEYVADEKKDPVDIYFLSKKFITTPKFTPTILKFGGNISIARMIHQNTTDSRANGKTEYGIKPGYHVGTGVDWNLNDNFSIGAELDFAFRSYTSKIVGVNGSDQVGNIEKQFWLDVPVFAKYTYHVGKIRPFAYAGYSINLLISSKAALDYINREATGDLRTQGADENFNYKQNHINRSLVFGGGIRYKLGRDFLIVDLRYIAGLTNLINPKYNFYSSKAANDYTMSSTIARYSYVGDYMRLDNLSLSLGYVRPLYDPRKIKRARTKAAMRKISKQKMK
jgi:opacity protein-like surface antigen